MTEVNIGNTQSEHLLDPQATAIEDAKDLGHDEVSQRRCPRIWCESINRVKQLLNLCVREDPRREDGGGLGAKRPVRHVGGIPKAAQVHRELTNHRNAGLLGVGAFMRHFGEPLPTERSRQLASIQPLVTQEGIEAAQDRGGEVIAVTARPLLLNELFHERRECAMAHELGDSIRHGAPPQC